MDLTLNVFFKRVENTKFAFLNKLDPIIKRVLQKKYWKSLCNKYIYTIIDC